MILDPRDYGAPYNGSSDDAPGIQAAVMDAFDNAGPDQPRVVQLPPGTGRLGSEIVVPPFVTVRGHYGPTRNAEPAQPNVLRALPSFSGNALIKMVDKIAGGYPYESYGQVIENLALDGGPAKANALFSGIRAEGVARGVTIRNVSIQHVSDRGLQGAPANGGTAYSWEVNNVQVLAAGVDGFRIAGMTDSTFKSCRALGCGRHGWYVDGSPNSTFNTCRSEWNGQQGWNLDGSWGSKTGSGGASFVNCSTDRNNYNGWLIKAQGTPTLSFTNPMCRRDGRNNGLGGSGYAAIRVEGATCPISIDNINVYPGIDDDGGGTLSPSYGFRAMNSVWVSVNSGYLHAASIPHANSGGNSYYYVGTNVGRATGPTETPTRL